MTSSRKVLLTATATALVLLAMPAQSAEEKGAGERGGGERGGFAAGRGMFNMGGGGKFFLVRLEQVQTELKITPEQKTQITELQTAMGQQIRELTPRGGMRDLPAEEREKLMTESREKREKITSESEAKLAKILNADQAKRLGEMSLQQRGVEGLKDKEVTKALELSEEQLKKLDEAIQYGRDEQVKLRQGGANRDREATTAAREKIRADVQAKAMAVLNAKQKEKYAAMKGAEFKLDPAAMRGPGRGAGGAGGGRRGGGGGPGGGGGGGGGGQQSV